MSESDLPCACTALRKASRAVTRLYDEAMAAEGLTTTQFALLRTLERGGTMPLTRLAGAMVMDRTSLYRLLAPLERAGSVEIADAARGRAKLARLTPGGAARTAAAVPRWDAVQARLVERFGANEWRALQGALHAITTLAVGEAA